MHLALHAQLAADPPDLAVWGEGALDPGAANDPETVADVEAAIAAVGSPTLVGAVLNDLDGTQHTSVVLLNGAGEPVDRYDKVHLVPFGEYVPWRDELSWVSAIRQVPVDRTPGERVHTVSVEGLPAFGTPICFENSFPSLVRDFIRDGAGFLVVLTVSDTRELADDKSGATLAERIDKAGHAVAARAIVTDDVEKIRAQVKAGSPIRRSTWSSPPAAPASPAAT